MKDITTIINSTSLQCGEYYYENPALWGDVIIRWYVDFDDIHLHIDIQGYDEFNKKWLYTEGIFNSLVDNKGLFYYPATNILFPKYRLKVSVDKIKKDKAPFYDTKAIEPKDFVERLRVVVVPGRGS